MRGKNSLLILPQAVCAKLVTLSTPTGDQDLREVADDDDDVDASAAPAAPAAPALLLVVAARCCRCCDDLAEPV